MTMVMQFGLTCVWGLLGFWLVWPDPNPEVPKLAALIFGFGGMWLTMFVYAWARYGWKAARTLRMDPRPSRSRPSLLD